MLCPSCGHECEPSARFCPGCGQSLANVCSHCARPLAAGAGFCDGCGTPVVETTQTVARIESTSRRPSAHLPRSFVGDRYIVKDFLEEGAAKKVYLVHDTLLDRDVAFAQIRTKGLDEAHRQRTLRKAQTMGRLGDHPHIVQIHDLGEDDGQLFMVMPLIPGGTVAQLIGNAPKHRISVERAITIAIEVCRGLQFAHSKGIVHRDLKPTNVWLGSDGTARIGDFGLAVSPEESRLTQAGMVVGTPLYMSPEQAVGGEVTPKSDLYSLGAMIYEMVTGRVPFMASDIIAVISHIVNTQPEEPRNHNSECPQELQSLILRLLAKDPTDRPESATVVLRELGAMAAGPTETEPDLGRHRHNLPAQLSSFIGREQEMAEVKRLLGATRLPTLTGAGGCGKSRLALQVASELLGDYPDGVWLVQLASVTDPSLVDREVTATVGPLDRNKRLLLVLDNCEHLLEACAQTAMRVLQEASLSRILATSREPLGVPGEVIFRVPPMSTPPSTDLSPDSLSTYEAVALFLDRAMLAQPSFALNQTTGPAVSQIARRLDRIPLAIELAAARVNVLSATEIARRLDDMFRLLSGGSRTALPQQRTLEAAIDWSYRLLSRVEQLLFNRLSVFRGGFTLEAAEQVAADPDQGPDVLELLSQLVNKSLVTVEHKDDSPTRYRLLETLRRYAWDRLHESGETTDRRDRHTRFFMELAQGVETKLLSPISAGLLTSLKDDIDNLRGAVEWALESNNPELVGSESMGSLVAIMMAL